MAIWTEAAARRGGAPARGHRVRRIVAVLAAAAVLAAVAVVAFLAGEHQQRPFTVLTGLATVGDHQATVIVAGWAYGIEGSVMWVDQQGSLHDEGWPSCLSTPGRTVPISFGEVPVTAQDGTSWRQVVWVDCRA
jgi:hypothetical protein